MAPRISLAYFHIHVHVSQLFGHALVHSKCIECNKFCIHLLYRFDNEQIAATTAKLSVKNLSEQPNLYICWKKYNDV